MSSRQKTRSHKDRRGSKPGEFAHGVGIRRLAVPEKLRWRMFDALVALHREHGRPILRSELAARLGMPVKAVHPNTLVSARYATIRAMPGSEWRSRDEKGFLPADLSVTRMGDALRALERASQGTHTYRVRVGARMVERRLKINASFKSRIRNLAKRLKRHLAIRRWDDITSERIPQVIDAVFDAEMERSLVPRSDWRTQTRMAKRARKNALNRQSEMRRFLEWAQHEGYVDLRFLALHNKSRKPMLTRAWAEFNALVPHKRTQNAPLTFAHRAMRFGADSPETLVAMGFERFAEWVEADGFMHQRGARAAVGRCRKVWNERARLRHDLPEWVPPIQHMRERLEDGGLVRTWWSAWGFIVGNETLLDRDGMEKQRRQAVDMRDWWTLSNPPSRSLSEGGPLPPRPDRARPGGRRIGARTEGERTAIKPLWTVTRLQRFAMTDDPIEAERIALDRMQAMDWGKLLKDVGRLERFVRYELQRSADEHDGRLVKTQGTDSALYVSLLAEVYFPAFLTDRLCKLEREEMNLPDTAAGDQRQREIGRERKRLLAEKAEWADIAAATLKLFGSEEIRLGGFRSMKAREAIADHLSHRDVGRIADAFRARRLDIEQDLRRKTDKLLTTNAQARREPCRIEVDGVACGQLQCDEHHPLPDVRHGIAADLVGRAYAFLVMKELWMRLPPLLPWRPSEFCRLRIGQHLNPKTLEVSAIRYKNPRTGVTVSRREAHLPSLKPIRGMDPEATPKMVEVLLLCIDLAQPFLAANPTSRGRRCKASIPMNDEHLFLSFDGLNTTKSKSLANTVGRTLEEGAKLVNESLADGETPITLPTGWGARGSYVFRFLWGHRSVEAGASMSSVALALGNTERTTREYYQAVRSDSAVNSVAAVTHKATPSSHFPVEPPGATGPDDAYVRELEMLCERREKGLLDEDEFTAWKKALRRRHGIG